MLLSAIILAWADKPQPDRGAPLYHARRPPGAEPGCQPGRACAFDHAWQPCYTAVLGREKEL